MCAGHYLMPHLGLLSYEQQHLWHKTVQSRRWNSAWFTSESQTSVKCGAAEGRRRTKAWLGKPTGPLKHSMLLASVGSLHRRENTSSKRLGSAPYPEHWIIFSFSYSNQVHMSSACCAAGVLTVLPVSFNVVVNHTSHISSQISARTDLSYHAISLACTYLECSFLVQTCKLS